MKVRNVQHAFLTGDRPGARLLWLLLWITIWVLGFALAELVIEILQSPSRIELVPYETAYAPGFEDMRRRKPVLDKLAACTGFRPATALRDIVAKTAARPISESTGRV